jgi:superfamily II RNA helicase
MDIMSLGRATKDVVTAQKTSADYRRQLEREFAQKVEEARKDVAAIGRSLGVSDEAMHKITQRLAGIA